MDRIQNFNERRYLLYWQFAVSVKKTVIFALPLKLFDPQRRRSPIVPLRQSWRLASSDGRLYNKSTRVFVNGSSRKALCFTADYYFFAIRSLRSLGRLPSQADKRTHRAVTSRQLKLSAKNTDKSHWQIGTLQVRNLQLTKVRG